MSCARHARPRRGRRGHAVERDGQARLRFDAHHRAARNAQARGAPGGAEPALQLGRGGAPRRPGCARPAQDGVVAGRRGGRANPPAGVEPVRWRLLTTHAAADVAAAWQIVDWYRLRWTIEQLFRLMKTHGLQLEDSQLASAEGLIKLAAIAAKAAAVTLQLVQARDGKSQEPAAIAFSAPEIALLDGLAPASTKAKRRCRRTRTRRTAWPGPPGSSPAWAAGTAIHPRSRQGRSRCGMAWSIFMPWPKVGTSEMCAYRSEGRGGRVPSPSGEGGPKGRGFRREPISSTLWARGRRR